MYKIPLADLKEKIVSSGKIGVTDLERKIKAKVNELSGLISEEGAAHIIANELGIDLVPGLDKLKIKNIYAGMRNISVAAKVVRKFEVREFQKEDRMGKVCSLIVGDETGTMRVVFWNEQVNLLSEVKENDTLLLKNVYVRENNGNKEIHLGTGGEVEVNPAAERIGEVRQSNGFSRKKIKELEGGEENIEILGTVVQAFDPRFFEVCPDCGKKVEGNICGAHGTVVPVSSYVLNLVMDDGTGTIRSVFWKNQTSHLLGKTEEEIRGYKEDLGNFEEVKTDLLGEQFRLMGRVRKNEMFGRLEFNVQMVAKAKPEEEIARLEAENN